MAQAQLSPLETLWNPAIDQECGNFDQLAIQNLPAPAPAQTYLRHAITEDWPLATEVRLTMTGEIKLKEKWLPFSATQVVTLDQGHVWQAHVKQGLLFIDGFDQYVDEIGAMNWKLMGLFPVMSATGPDITRSAADRYAIERIFLPSALSMPEVTWAAEGGKITATVPGSSPITLDTTPTGRVRAVSMLRWGNPEGGPCGLKPFGGYVDEDQTWHGYTIPSKLRIGWHFGTDRFEEGEFYHATITNAEFK